MNYSVIIIGTVPPPIGGVTVHTLRLIKGLKSLGYNHKFINLRQRTNDKKLDKKSYIYNILKFIKYREIKVVHYQLNNIFELTLIVIICILKNSRIITTVHSFRPDLFNRIKKTLFYFILRTRTEFVAPSETIKDALISVGVKQNKVKVLNTFLPPSELEINKKLPDEVMEFLNNKSNIIVANAYKLYLDEYGVDVYGLDMCIEACKAIPESNFIFCVPLIDDFDYYNQCLKNIKEYNIKDRFLIINKNISLVSLFKFADLFVRPTSTDSFGISVAEAISMGVQAIASNVCNRAEGAIIFENRNIDSFINTIISYSKVTHNKEKHEKKDDKFKYLNEYIDIYNESYL